MDTTTLIGLSVIVLIVGYAIVIYNHLVTLKNRFKNAFAQIDVQLKRRHDLIPNLIETAQGYLTHERETLARVTEARSGAMQAQDNARKDPGDGQKMNSLASAENMLTKALGGLYAVAENYPDLKADETMQQVMEELSSTENRIAFARQSFNDSVMDYNTYREKFPNNFMAGFFAFKSAGLLEFDTEALNEPPSVSFS